MHENSLENDENDVQDHKVKLRNETIVALEKLKSEIMRNDTEPLLTLFTTWNNSPVKNAVHNITLRNWMTLRPYVVPVIFLYDNLTKQAGGGIPILKYMYIDVMRLFKSTFYAYSNADILFTDTLIYTLFSLKEYMKHISMPILVVGKRHNVNFLTMSEGLSWKSITQVAQMRGKLFNGFAEDYFITTPEYPWRDIAEVVIGRPAYDNWLVYRSRKLQVNVIDSTNTILAVHQTTGSGNYEGHKQTNSNYNHNLLVKLYKFIKYKTGFIECIEKYTDYKNEILLVKTRIVEKQCTV
ncbi:uncharacterized protein LOC132750783 [Ruditapes philippinarum]|uniref:uncharacterized protein LOC132750783 n=1 Tax=Ruditapes philippinarum TaxID=129788 RepID=UPI00295C2652|nr:uncharacterized protein LOC132750783 [Ruditapes philippinarum]